MLLEAQVIGDVAEVKPCFSHDKTNGHDEWLTPPQIIQSLGSFDLDPCSPINRPWPTAKCHFTVLDNGLSKSWEGRVWLNPPYGSEMVKWMGRMAGHGDGIALIFARTETEAFFEHVWPKADALLFIKGRIRFFKVDGTESGTSGAPSVLIAYGLKNVAALYNSGIEGRIVHL